jgi:hypothetical protein
VFHLSFFLFLFSPAMLFTFLTFNCHSLSLSFLHFTSFTFCFLCHLLLLVDYILHHSFISVLNFALFLLNFRLCPSIFPRRLFPSLLSVASHSHFASLLTWPHMWFRQ